MKQIDSAELDAIKRGVDNGCPNYGVISRLLDHIAWQDAEIARGHSLASSTAQSSVKLKRLTAEELDRIICKAAKGQRLFRWQQQALFDHIAALEADLSRVRREANAKLLVPMELEV